jgi:hypothetical protein
MRIKKEGNGQRRWGMEKQCIGSQGSKRTVVLDKKKKKIMKQTRVEL